MINDVIICQEQVEPLMTPVHIMFVLACDRS